MTFQLMSTEAKMWSLCFLTQNAGVFPWVMLSDPLPSTDYSQISVPVFQAPLHSRRELRAFVNG